MFLYDNSHYICSCGNSLVNSENGSSLAPRSTHKLPDLYFCPKCHVPKCAHCCDVTVVCKYCANCMSDYTDYPGMTRCSKNCFECPQCSSPISVSIHDEVEGKLSGKKFNFNCGQCSYTYTTKLVTKPAPLSTILKNEQPTYFSKLQEKYALSHKLQQRRGDTDQRRKPSVSHTTLDRMKKMKISQPSQGAPDEIEELEIKLSQFTPRAVDIDADFVKKRQVEAPRGCHLSGKSAYSCNSCGIRLLSPIADARSMKFLERELAPEVMPLALAKAVPGPNEQTPIGVLGEDTSCVLSIVNPTLNSINITIATLEHIPTKISGIDLRTAVSLPVTSAIIPARREKANVLESIPTVYLSDVTQASRGESLTRTIRREGLRRSTGPEEPYVEEGMNWISLPFAVTIFRNDLSEDTDGHQSRSEELSTGNDETKRIQLSRLKIPFHITVETRAPSHWNKECKKGLKFGFWVICDVSIPP